MAAGIEIFSSSGKVQLTTEYRVARHFGTYSTTIATNNLKSLTFYVTGIYDSPNFLVVPDFDMAIPKITTGVVTVYAPTATAGDQPSFNAGTYYIQVFEVF